jgi:hypothetical protein
MGQAVVLKRILIPKGLGIVPHEAFYYALVFSVLCSKEKRSIKILMTVAAYDQKL